MVSAHADAADYMVIPTAFVDSNHVVLTFPKHHQFPVPGPNLSQNSSSVAMVLVGG